MIGKLRGVVDSSGDDHVVLDVNGVGYLVHCSARTLGRLPAPGAETTLSIDTHVREDMIRLYGFGSDAEREWFRLAQTVQGVGAKVALAILSILDPGELATAVARGDKGAIARAPGVGPKLAARLVAELKDRAPSFAIGYPALAGAPGAVPDPAAPPAVSDAISALVNLGYAPVQAATAVSTVVEQAGNEPDARVLIRLGLRELAR